MVAIFTGTGIFPRNQENCGFMDLVLEKILRYCADGQVKTLACKW